MNNSERRKERRFKLKDPVFAVMYGSQTIISQVTDISKSGLAIRYVKNEDISNELIELDIYKSDFRFCIENIKAKIISDNEMSNDLFLETEETRRCGVQFENLSDIQISQLENVIQNFTLAKRDFRQSGYND